jgi:leucyl aminopeptidase
MKPVLKPFPKGNLPAESVHTVRFFYDGEIEAFKKGSGRVAARFPKKAFAELTLSEREPAKAVTIPFGYAALETLFFFRAGTKTFALHEAIRKSVDFDPEKTGTLALDLSSLDAADAERVLNALGNLLVLAAYEPTKFGKKAEKKKKEEPFEVLLSSPLSGGEAKEIFENALSQARAANLVRTLAELPANELRPASYLARIRALAKEWGARIEFLDQKALEKRGANAFLAVVRANPEELYGIAKLSFAPKGKSSGRRLALVGKGLCFDTGGYNLKLGESMLEMHRDMTGSAVALATFGHLIERGTKDEIECYLALAENLIGPSAYRPNEVVVASNGVSIEVVDTDAEGRMVLSDTLVMACEKNPHLVIDYATLTGAVIRSIDTRRSGVFSNREALREMAVQAGEIAGERVWGFPIGEDYWEAIQSDIADIRQCATTNNCDHIYAATFLSNFVKPEVPWIHVDLASESHKGGLGLSAKDITGFGIRLTEEILRRFQPEKRKA